MVQIISVGTKKAYLFTIGVILVFLTLIFLTETFKERNSGINKDILLLTSAEKAMFVADDISSGVYNDILGTNIKSISGNSTMDIEFNNTILSQDRNQQNLINSYKSFIEGIYSQANNMNISLIGFNTSFFISPYNTTFFINGTLLRIYTMQTANHVESISITARVNSSSIGLCEQPAGDSGSFPSTTFVSVTYINKTGGICSKSANLNPAEDNSISGKQFYQSLGEPSGSIDTKFGRISSQNGVLEISIANSTATFESIKISYGKLDDKITIYGGNISLSFLGISKNTRIIIAEE